MSADAIWVTEAEVVQLMDLKEAIVALEAALREEARGDAYNMTKTLLQYGRNNLHAIGGKLGNLVGTKTWTHTQVGTMLAVRVIERLQIYSPREESRQVFAAKAREELGIEAVNCASVSEAC